MIEYTCVNCNDKFMSRPDHGKDRKFCSRKCWLETCTTSIEKKCKNCGCMFKARKSRVDRCGDDRTLYCSKKCRTEDIIKCREKSCAHCGKLFYPIGKERVEKQMTCSNACSSKYFFSGANNPSFKGGVHIEQYSNRKMVLVGDRNGFVSKYIPEHRLLIAQHLGRMLTRNETVIHINNDGLDNNLSNLYLCESMSEYSKRRHGSLPWPKVSNLEHYKEKYDATDRVG